MTYVSISPNVNKMEQKIRENLISLITNSPKNGNKITEHLIIRICGIFLSQTIQLFKICIIALIDQ